MINLCINDENDIVVDNNGNVKSLDGLESLMQKIKTRLSVFRGECFLNNNIGLPYNDFWEKIKDERVIKSIIETEIMKEKEVVNIISNELKKINRSLKVKIVVSTIYGQSEFETDII